jgi:hypothetical protein
MVLNHLGADISCDFIQGTLEPIEHKPKNDEGINLSRISTQKEQ